MLSVEAQIGIRMKNLGFGEPLSRKSVQELPRHPAPLTATANHPQPAFANFEPKTPETGEIAGYGVIVEVALNHTPQPFPDFRQRLKQVKIALRKRMRLTRRARCIPVETHTRNPESPPHKSD